MKNGGGSRREGDIGTKPSSIKLAVVGQGAQHLGCAGVIGGKPVWLQRGQQGVT